MRIIHYTSILTHAVGGPVRAILDLSGSLAESGNQVELATSDGEAWPTEWPGDRQNRRRGVPNLWKLETPALPMALFSPRQIAAIRRGMVGADVIHLHGVWEPSNQQIARIARGLEIPYVITLHGMLDDWCMAQSAAKKRVFMTLAGRQMLNGAARIICSAQGELEQASKWFSTGRGVVIPNLMDLDPYKNLEGPAKARAAFPALNSGRPNILFLSRLHYKKGADVLIDAAGQLRDRGVEANVLIAGGGDDAYVAQLKAQISAKGLEDRVHLLGMVKSPTKESLYQACDVFALPTSQENFGFVFYEAMASGTPIVTTPNVDTASELLGSGGSVIVAQKASAFADALAGLLADAPARSEMGRVGRQWVLESQNPARVVRMFESAYAESVAAQDRGTVLAPNFGRPIPAH